MSEIIDELYNVILNRMKEKPSNSYTVELLSKGKGYIARKVGEEAVEVIVASLNEGKERTISEIADLMYHLLVLMAVDGISPQDIYEELRRRRR
ncbi:MAG: phosphoribosyl-ATP diphosphatase [Sulfolobaceae archaeon]|nr:phosphoribosyl-ATP diphosphatase [Sulfolobaceae archaeon]